MSTRLHIPRRRVDAAVFLAHWAVVAASLVSGLTGIRIAADHDPFWKGIATALGPWVPQGPVFAWHIVSGFVFGAAALTGAVTVMLGGRRRWRIGAGTSRVRQANVALHWLAAGLVAALLATGLIQLGEAPGPVGIQAVAALHGILATGLGLYAVAHVGAHALDGGPRGWLPMLLPARGGPRLTLAGTSVLVLAGLAFVADGRFARTLPASRVTPAQFALDGRLAEPFWADARPVTIEARRGNAPEPVPMTVRAAHDGAYLFLAVSWRDGEASLKHLPLVRDDAHWRVLHDGFEISDERTWYEDKLAVAIAASGTAAIRRAIHLGPRALGEVASPHDRGLHAARERIDLWHWKAVRTDIMDLAEDQSFGPPLPAYRSDVSYSGGYRSDPRSGGGYTWNWVYFNPSQVTPKRLPADPRLYGTFVEDAGDGLPQSYGSMRWLESRPFDVAEDLPAGTAIPSYLRLGDFEGDIADVSAKGRWRDGRWTVEFVRRLDADSPFDVRLGDGALLWFAPFDHAQSRHAYHLRPLRLALRERGL